VTLLFIDGVRSLSPMSTTTELRAILGDLADTVLPHLQGRLVPISKGRKAMSSAHDADLGDFFLAPTMYPYQRAGAAFAAEVRRAMIAYDMGLGKTITAIGTVVREELFPAVVVCPPSLVLNWRNEFAKFTPGVRTHVIRGTEITDLPDADVYIIGDAIIGERKATKKLAATPGWAPTLAELGPRALVIDESHRMKNRKAARTIAARAIARKVDDKGVVVLLSGTPMKSNAGELLEQFQIMGVVEQIWGSPFLFLDRFYPKVDEWGARESDNEDELHAEMTDTVVARLTFADVAYQLGDAAPKGRLRVPTATPLQGTAAARYEDKIEELRQLRRQSREHPGSVPRGAILKVYGELRRLIGEAKLPAVAEHVENLIEQGEQVIVFAHHRAIVDHLAKKFNAPRLWGGMQPTEVETAKAVFQAGHARVLVANLNAGGVGHNLTAAKHVVFAELGQTPDELTQAEARADRLGQTELVLCHWMIGANGRDTFDDRIIAALNGKQRSVSTTLDGRSAQLLDETAEPISIEEALDAWDLED
jgi:SNF2 family DNA or RNA helicase